MFIGGPDGVVKAFAVKRLPKEDRYDLAAALAVKGIPGRPVPGRLAVEVPTQINIDMGDEVNMDEPGEAEAQARRVYISRQDLAEHGFTPGCPKCQNLASGLKAQGRNHNEECRTRLEAKLRATPMGRMRVQDAENKFFRDIEPTETEETPAPRGMPVSFAPGGGEHANIPSADLPQDGNAEEDVQFRQFVQSEGFEAEEVAAASAAEKRSSSTGEASSSGRWRGRR